MNMLLLLPLLQLCHLEFATFEFKKKKQYSGKYFEGTAPNIF